MVTTKLTNRDSHNLLCTKKIDKHPTCLEIYKQQLLSDGVLNENDIKSTSQLVQKCFDDAFEAADSYV